MDSKYAWTRNFPFSSNFNKIDRVLNKSACFAARILGFNKVDQKRIWKCSAEQSDLVAVILESGIVFLVFDFKKIIYYKHLCVAVNFQTQILFQNNFAHKQSIEHRVASRQTIQFYSFQLQNTINLLTRLYNSPARIMDPLTANKMAASCKINATERGEVRKEILYMQEKYDRIKKKMYQKKLLDQLNEHDIQEIGNIMNIIAMKYSQDGQNQCAEEWLRRALKHGEVSQRVRIVTFNNMACVYKQANDLPMALFYINKAQKEADYFCLEMQDDKFVRVVTDCSLNLCAILSAMGEHYKALRAARKALSVLKSHKNLPESYYHSLFPIMKYNEGVELERLKMYEEAEEAYQEAQACPSITPQLSDRLAKAIEQVRAVKLKTKQRTKTIQRSAGKRVRLSLPKFCSSENSQVCRTAQKNAKSDRKGFSCKKPQQENQRNYRSIEPKSKPAKIHLENYHSNKTTARTTARPSNALESIQNF